MQDAKQICFYPSETGSELGRKALEILAFTASGLKSKQIARTVNRSVPNVQYHQNNARQYYDAVNLTQAVAKAIALGDIQFRVDMATEKTTAQRCTAFGFIFAALITAIIDTPFFSDVDQDLARHSRVRTTRTIKVRHGRRLDLINEELIG